MNSTFHDFAKDLVEALLRETKSLSSDRHNDCRLLAARTDGSVVSLDLTPVESIPQPVTAQSWFRGVHTTADLIDAYNRCRAAVPLEESLPDAVDHVDGYADRFLDQIFTRARSELTDHEAGVIAEWVADLDIYMAIKAVESLLNSREDRMLLQVAKALDWVVHMDHVAIRCGSQRNGDARRIADFLCDQFGYVAPQVAGEAFYRFNDGWDALPVYKMLDNGVMLRAFVDESAQDHQQQIIQHWNRVYGYTAHHLALRASRYTALGWAAVPLVEITEALADKDVHTMAPTGGYTAGLLEQVFTRPSHTADVPLAIKRELSEYGEGLEKMIENGKLIELVSRREMSPEFAQRYFGLYGISYEADNPLHSAPAYTYFLPAQAAHVIRTSVEIA